MCAFENLSVIIGALNNFKHVAHRREWVPELVRKCRQKLILPPIVFGEAGCQYAQIVFQPFSFGNILTDRPKPDGPVGGVGQLQNFVDHPASFTCFEMPKANLEFTMTFFQDVGKKLVYDPWLIFGKEKFCNRRAASLFDAVQADYFQPSAIDEERKTVNVTHADEVGAVLNHRDKICPIALDARAFGDVAHDLGSANHIACVVLDWRDSKRDDDALPVTAHSLCLKMLDSFPRF